MSDEAKKPLLNFSAETTPEILASFQKALLVETRRLIDAESEHLRDLITEARLFGRQVEIHGAIGASRISLQLETILDRIERLERGVRRLEKSRSGISGLFRRPT
jgi:hypothetical protein